MSSRITIFDRLGNPLKELECIIQRQWLINEASTLTFKINPQGMKDYVQFGNYILIEHDKLQSWIGIIEMPRSWGSEFKVTAKSVFNIFNLRVGGVKHQVSGTFGSIFLGFLNWCEQQEPSLLYPRDIFLGGQFYPTMIVDASNVGEYFKKALAEYKCRVDFREDIKSDGKLRVAVDLSETIYTETDLILDDTINIKNTNPILLEQGDVWNDVACLSVDISADTARLYARRLSQPSINRYGLRQILLTQGSTQAEVDAAALLYLVAHEVPRVAMTFTVLDVGDTFNKLRVGSLVHVILRSAGFLGNDIGYDNVTYIKSILYSDDTNEAQVVCQEVMSG